MRLSEIKSKEKISKSEIAMLCIKENVPIWKVAADNDIPICKVKYIIKEVLSAPERNRN